MYTPEPIL